MRDLARSIAVFMVTNPKNVEAVKTFSRFLEECIRSQRLGNPLTKQWQTAVNEYVHRISNLNEHDLKRDEWQSLGLILKELDRAGYDGMLDRAGYCFYYAGKYQSAADCWDQCRATRKREYYLAKAEVFGLPGGLEWLARLPEADGRILDEWGKAGGLERATDRRWLEHVGPVLERKKRYWEAFQVYMKLEDTRQVLGCFAQTSRRLSPSDFWAGLVSLVNYLIQQDLWAEVLDVLDEYFPAVVGRDAEKARLRCDVVRELAYSDLTAKSITVNDRQRYEKFIDQVQSVPDWQQHLSVKEVGAALEKVGGHVSTLRFYGRFVLNTNPELQKFARERWIVTKRKQEDYFRNQGQRDRVEQIKTELANQAYDWGIRSDINLPLYPQLEAREVKGLPLGTKVEQLSDGNLRFQIGSTEVRTKRDAGLVLITDTITFEVLRVDLVRGQVSGLEGVEIYHEHRGGRLSFKVPAGGYSGRAFYGGEKPLLELRVQGVSDTISLEL